MMWSFTCHIADDTFLSFFFQYLLLIQIWRPDFSSFGWCPRLFYPMILLQHAGLPPPKRPSPSPPMSVAARSTGALQLPPQKPFGQEASLPLAGEEEPPKGGEQDTALEELCKPLYCKLCNVTLNSAQQAQAHYQVREEEKSSIWWENISGLCSIHRCLWNDHLCLE